MFTTADAKLTYSGSVDLPLHLRATPKILLMPSGINVQAIIRKYEPPVMTTNSSLVKSFTKELEHPSATPENNMPVISITKKLRQMLFSSASLSPFPIYLDIIIPAIAPIAPITNAYINPGLPAISTAAILCSPSCPTIIWSIIEKEDCSIDCNATGTAMSATSLVNFLFILHPPIFSSEKIILQECCKNQRLIA